MKQKYSNDTTVFSRERWLLTLSCPTSGAGNRINSEHIHASDKYILSFMILRSFAVQIELKFNVAEKYCNIQQMAALPYQ